MHTTSATEENYLLREDIVKAFTDFSGSPRKAFVANVFLSDESSDMHAFVSLLTTDATLYLGSNPPVHGKENIENMLVDIFKTFMHLRHHLIKVFKDDEQEIVYAAEATYTFLDGSSTIPIPYMVHLSFTGELAHAYRIYIDLNPFYQHQAAA